MIGALLRHPLDRASHFVFDRPTGVITVRWYLGTGVYPREPLASPPAQRHLSRGHFGRREYPTQPTALVIIAFMRRAIQRVCSAALVATLGCYGCNAGDSQGGYSGSRAPAASTSPAAPPTVERRTRAGAPPTDVVTPFTHEGDAEYQNGLVSFTPMAPAFADGLGLIESVFSVGYLTGILEAKDYQFFLDGKVSALGCRYGLAAAQDTPPSEAELARSNCASDRPESGPQGPRFAASRLKAAQGFAKSFRDPREIEILILIHSVGYNMGFAHEWEAVDHEARVEKIVGDRCQDVVQKVQPPLSPTQLVASGAKCEVKARESKAEFGHQFRCLLVGPGMNSELSGLASKPGCTLARHDAGH